ncbi:hypothetical protein [Nitrosovibrio sp. Nv4]|uniref:hypothetical protein n=1 Tax=Nitrosovibrio sp. Nv4 TaxID=1945880 RepID=UPI000BCC21CE|nr:hypothetical protein [Nitrosovibrio sp. Nv4]SOD42496.1 hypothetical protein SAMN06298226_2839 [Nitrosovibrio sp. Nv4]
MKSGTSVFCTVVAAVLSLACSSSIAALGRNKHPAHQTPFRVKGFQPHALN